MSIESPGNDEFSPAAREALIAAGGCAHTPNPFKGCDTCSRPPIRVPTEGATAYGFVAEMADGTVIAKADAPSVDHLPLEAVRGLVVLTDDPRIPRITLDVDPEKGERLYRFARRASRIAAGAGGIASSLTVQVLEVRLANGQAVRLYLHPTQGPILSTRDLYF